MRAFLGLDILQIGGQEDLDTEKKIKKDRYPPKVGKGRNTVSGVLFRKRELTEFCAKLGEFCKKLSEFPEFSPRNSVRAKKLTEFGVETVLSETIFGPFPKKTSRYQLKESPASLEVSELLYNGHQENDLQGQGHNCQRGRQLTSKP